MPFADIAIRYQVRAGWIRFVIAVANWLSRRNLRMLAGIWLWLLQPTFIIGIHIMGQRKRLGPFRFGKRWSYHRMNIRVHLTLSRQQETAA